MRSITLNSTEKSVLNLLNSNSRLSFSQMGLKINKSQQFVSFIVKKLMDKEIINNYYTLIDYSRLGVLNFRVYFKLSYSDKNRMKTFIDYLIEQSNISRITTCGEKYDLICSFYASNPSQFNKNLKQIIMKFSRLINEYTLVTTIVVRVFTNTNSRGIIIGGDREEIILKKVDLSILNLISENSRMNSVDIGNKLNLTPKTIISHIKKLETKKIILGYTTNMNIKQLNKNSILLLIKYNNTFVKLEQKFVDYLITKQEVTGIIKILGEWDLEITLIIENSDQFRNLELEIKEKFAHLIYDIQNIPLYEEKKINFFPKYILEKYNMKSIKNKKTKQ